MQQYFIQKKLNINDVVFLDENILYHLIKVLRKDNNYIFRLCDSSHEIYLAHLIDKKSCVIFDNLNENNELDTDITCILSLIKLDKFELTLQKLVEIGIKRIVPYVANRSVVKVYDKKKERFNKIIIEACEQSHRNIVPELCDICSINDLKQYLSDENYICYEAEDNICEIKKANSISYIIGPEGGFDDEEYHKIVSLGFKSISLGKRILRAETAAIFMGSLIVGKNQ